MSPFKDSELAILVYWMLERDRIRAAKEAGRPRPWSPDPIFQGYRFCNVRRMDDRVSRWLLQNWYGWYGWSWTSGAALAASVLARLVNWPDALQEVKTAWIEGAAELNTARHVLQERARRGEKVFTGAYVVPGFPGWSKVYSVCHIAGTALDRADAILNRDSMRGVWDELTHIEGIGSFLAGQIVADLAHTHVGCAWMDRSTWAPVGPGSARGINRLRGIPKDNPISQAHFEDLMPALIAEIRPRVADLWADRRLQAMDVQNCLCEFDKYRRLTLGEGKVRATYNGRAETAGMF